jgi:hypothetical protein
VGNTRKIKVNKIDQSVNHTSEQARRLVWGRTVEILKEEEPNLKNALLLGLGGGTVAHRKEVLIDALARNLFLGMKAMELDVRCAGWDAGSARHGRVFI